MNDTHGVTGQGWYAFDLDGTLAVYDKWQGIDHIGEPVKPMVDLIKRMHAEGKVVKILTARVAPRANAEYKPNPFLGAPPGKLPPVYPFADGNEYKVLYGMAEWGAWQFITDWCARNLGFIPAITHEKDHLMLELYDDRVKQVVPNKGILVEDVADRNYRAAENLFRENLMLQRKVDCKFSGFMAGLSIGVLIIAVWVILSGFVFKDRTPARERFEKAHAALCELLRDWPGDPAEKPSADTTYRGGGFTAGAGGTEE